MKTLDKNEMKNVKGGGGTMCYYALRQTTFCKYISEDGKTACLGFYDWSGVTISLVCESSAKN